MKILILTAKLTRPEKKAVIVSKFTFTSRTNCSSSGSISNSSASG